VLEPDGTTYRKNIKREHVDKMDDMNAKLDAEHKKDEDALKSKMTNFFKKRKKKSSKDKKSQIDKNEEKSQIDLNEDDDFSSELPKIMRDEKSRPSKYETLA
jgi:hypothetical protein